MTLSRTDIAEPGGIPVGIVIRAEFVFPPVNDPKDQLKDQLEDEQP